MGVRIYTQATWDDPGSQSTHSFLAPILPRLDVSRFEDTAWARAGSNHLSLVERPGDADAIALPDFYYLATEDAVREAAALADQVGKPLVLFGHTDHFRAPAALARHTMLFHSDLYRSRRKAYQRVHPTLLTLNMDPNELLEEQWFPSPHVWPPRVFWRGAGHLGSEPAHRRIAFRLTRNWRTVRLRAARQLATSREVTFTSTFTSGWWSSGPGEKRQKRLLFVGDAMACPYALVVRGSGNYSFRLYEVMALGRIPVIVDTDTCLPWAELIDWEDISVLVAQRDLRRIGDVVREFHGRFDETTFRDLQYRIREIWNDYLSEVGFYRTLCSDLEARAR